MDISTWNLLKIPHKEPQKKVLKKVPSEPIVWIVLIGQMLFNQSLADICCSPGLSSLVSLQSPKMAGLSKDCLNICKKSSELNGLKTQISSVVFTLEHQQ